MLDFDSIPRIIVLFWFHFFELSRELETELRTEIVKKRRLLPGSKRCNFNH
jgi:hypothetical protein